VTAAENTRIDPAFCDELRGRVGLSVVIGRVVALKKRGREHTGLCPFHGEKTPSFTVNDAKGFFHCFGCGAHGDAIGFVMKALGLTFPQAVAELARECGMSDRLGQVAKPSPAQQAAAQEARQKLMAERDRQAADETASAERQRLAGLALLREALPLWGTPAQFYLEARGIRESQMRWWWEHAAPPLRFHRAILHLESRRKLAAMVAPITRTGHANKEFIGLHRTFLEVDGSAKAEVTPNKKVLGAVSGGVIRLAPAGEHLVLAEGIETACSCMQATGLPAWAGVSLGNMAGRGDREAQRRAGWHPTRRDPRTHQRLFLPTTVPDMEAPGIVLPPLVRRLTIAADNDSKDAESAHCLIERAANRFSQMGLKVDIAWPPKGSDFNDVLRAGVGPGRPAQNQKGGEA